MSCVALTAELDAALPGALLKNHFGGGEDPVSAFHRGKGGPQIHRVRVGLEMPG